MAETAIPQAPAKEAPAQGGPAAGAAPKEVLASAAFKACAEKLGQIAGKPVVIGAAARQDLAQWPNGHVPPKWLLADWAFEGELKGNVYLAMEEAPFFALGAFARKEAADAVKARLASLELADADVAALREAVGALSGTIDETLRATTGKKVQLNLVKFDASSKMPMHPDANRIAFVAPIDLENGFSKGQAALIFSSTLGEWLGVPAGVQTGASAGVAAGEGQPGDLAPAGPVVWWKILAPKATALALFGKEKALDRAAAVVEALKIPCHRPQSESELQALLQSDAGVAVLVHPEGIKDPWLRVLAKLRQTDEGRRRRLFVSLPAAQRSLLKAAYALPPTGVWTPPYDASVLTKLLLSPLPCA